MQSRREGGKVAWKRAGLDMGRRERSFPAEAPGEKRLVVKHGARVELVQKST